MVGDDPVYLTKILTQSFATEDIVFCFGGIGAAPDDRTRQCAADALSLPLERHPEAVAEIESQFAEQVYPMRNSYGRVPKRGGYYP